MKVFVSVDLEGVAGISDWEQCIPGGDDYALGRELALGEVNAAIEGALQAGASQILVNDSHSFMRNLPPGGLAGHASYLSGRFKPLYMMEGLDASYDAVVFLGYHAAMPTPGILSHTYNPRAISDVRLNGVVTGGTLGVSGTATVTIANSGTLNTSTMAISGGALAIDGTANTSVYDQSGGVVGGTGNLVVGSSFSQTGGSFGNQFNVLSVTQAVGDISGSGFGAVGQLSLSAPGGAVAWAGEADGHGDVPPCLGQAPGTRAGREGAQGVKSKPLGVQGRLNTGSSFVERVPHQSVEGGT